MKILIVCVLAVAAGFVQSFTGFGAAAIMMSVLPYFFNIVEAPTISQIVSGALCAMILFRERKSIRFREFLFPTLIYGFGSIIIILLSPSFDHRALTIALGAFLVLLSIYCLFASSRIHIHGSAFATCAISAFCGVTAGLFGVGGPLMATYLLSITADHSVYLANLQLMFLATNLASVVTRYAKGMVTAEILPVCIWGLLFISIGGLIGEKLLRRIMNSASDSRRIVKTVGFIFVGVSGILTILTQLRP